MRPLNLLVEKIQRHANAAASNEAVFIEQTLRAFVEWGFSSARYYEITKNPADRHNETLVLRAFAHWDPDVKHPIGRSISYPYSTMGASGNKSDIVAGSPDDAPYGSESWIRDFQLGNERWVDVAFRDHKGELYGLLAISKPLSSAAFSESDMIALASIKSVFELYYSAYRLRQIDHLRTVIAQYLQKTKTQQVSIRDIADLFGSIISEVVAPQACAVFLYEWPTRTLIKLCEVNGFRGIAEVPRFQERYGVGTFLTGYAWENPEFRHIPNFASFMESHSALVNAQSLEFHSKTYGALNSVLYEKIGTGLNRLFMRLVNRNENPIMPFNYTQVEILRSACNEFSEFLDDYTSLTIVKEFAGLSTLGIRTLIDTEKAISACSTALDNLGFPEATLLFSPKAAINRVEVLFCNDQLVRDILGDAPIDLRHNASVKKLLERTGNRVIRTSDAKSATTDILATSLRERGTTHLIGFCASGEGGSVAALKCIHDAEAKLSSRTSLFDETTDADVIPALLSVLGSAIEASRSTVSADFAEELVAHFGHEVVSPIAKLQSQSIDGLNIALESLIAHGGSANDIKLIEEKKSLIDVQSHHISHQTKSAIALADRSFGSIDVNFRELNWSTIIEDAWVEAMEWKSGMEGRSAARELVISPNLAITRMKIVGDYNLLRGIIANLLKNAVKYSLPRERGEPMRIRILGIPQAYVDILQIENWGIGIPSEKREMIFQKFTRVDRTDKIRPIRGMGLGLYISRLYAGVHNGELFCSHSKPTLDDQTRTANLEGYLTQFELRVPHGLPKGIRKIPLTPS